VLFDFPSQFNLPPLRLVVGVLDFCVDKLELADFLCLAGAAPSIVWPFPVGGPSGAWRRAPLCASSASLNDTSVAWRSTERAKTVARLVAQQLVANGTIADAKAQLRAVGLNPRRFFRRGTYVLPPFCDDVFEDLVSAGAVRFYSCLLHQHWLGLVGHHGIMRCVRSLDWNQLGMINQLLVDMPRASGFVHFTKAQFVQVASIRDALASMRAAAPATLAAKKYYSITARVGSGRQKRALAVLLVPILLHCNLTDWARMLSAMLLYTHALDTDNIVAAEKMWRAATRCMVGADAPEFAYPPSIAKLDGGRDAKNARLWAVPKARDEALAVVSVPFFGPARLATTAGNEHEHKLFKRLMQRHSQFHPISGGAAALSGRTRAESATALAVHAGHAGGRGASVTDADVGRGRFGRMQVAAFVEENSRVEKHVAPELIATLRRHMLLGDADETDTVIKPNSLSVRSGRLRIWQRSSSSSSNDETRDAATSDRERRTTLLAPSTPSVPTFVRFVTISDTDDELLTSFDAARHSGRSRIGKLVGVHQVRFKLNARGQRFQSRLFVELQLYRASEQDPIWCYAKLTRSMAHVFVAVDELALLERIYVTEHLAMQCLWHWLM
jgi:hypothetical protein